MLWKSGEELFVLYLKPHCKETASEKEKIKF